MRRTLYLILVLPAALSVPLIGGYAPVAVGTLLDTWIVLFVVLCILRSRVVTPLALGVVITYALSRLVPALATEAPLLDFAQAYKWVLYLAAFVLALGRAWGPVRPLIRVVFTLLLFALAKALLTVAVAGTGARSGLLTENNFEIALFVGLIAVTYGAMSARQRFWAVTVVGAITVLSGSRSGVVAFVILVIYVIAQTKRLNLFLRYLLALVLPVVLWYASSVFTERAVQTGGVVDRLNFLSVFLLETSDWGPHTWLLGTTPLTPLSTEACGALSYYQYLFATTGDGTCYSVVLHAFTLRVLFDAGILGLLLAFGTAFYALRTSKVSPGLILALLLVAFTNGLSVSGLNNAYVALPILIAIGLRATTPGSSPEIASEGWQRPIQRRNTTSRPS